MVIILGNCYDEKNKLNKTFRNQVSLTGTLKNETSITNPEILFEYANPSNFNYLYIEEFSRYYFITDIVNVRNNLWRITARVDVLMSFRDKINSCVVTLSNTEDVGQESYMSGDVWRSLVKQKTDVINFPDGLNSNGEYILITSGG